MGEQIRNKVANLSGNSKYHQTIICLAGTELKRESVQKGAKRVTEAGEKEGRNTVKKGRERECATQLCQIWNQAQENNFSTTFVTGCIKSGLHPHYKLKNHSRWPNINHSQ